MLELFLIVLNVCTFVTAGVDKRRAIRQQWRISERMLLTLAFFGGALGLYVAMKVFRHKTRKATFRYFVPIVLIVQIFVYFLLMTSIL